MDDVEIILYESAFLKTIEQTLAEIVDIALSSFAKEASDATTHERSPKLDLGCSGSPRYLQLVLHRLAWRVDISSAR